jgi:hypothetical protein
VGTATACDPFALTLPVECQCCVRWHMHDRTAYVTGARLLGLLALMGLLLDAQSLHCQQLPASASLPAAQVQLPVVNLGETNFEDGFGAPGWSLEEFSESSVADRLRVLPNARKRQTWVQRLLVAAVDRRQDQWRQPCQFGRTHCRSWPGTPIGRSRPLVPCEWRHGSGYTQSAERNQGDFPSVQSSGRRALNTRRLNSSTCLQLFR